MAAPKAKLARIKTLNLDAPRAYEADASKLFDTGISRYPINVYGGHDIAMADFDESKETFTLGLHDAAEGACIGNIQPMADGSIADDNAPLTLVGGDRSVSEGAGSVTITASLSSQRGADTVVKLNINPSDMPQRKRPPSAKTICCRPMPRASTSNPF